MNEMSAGGFSEELINEIHMMTEENETSVDFAYAEQCGSEGKDETLDEKTYDLQQRQQCYRTTKRRAAPRRVTQEDRRRLLRAVEKSTQPLTNKMLNQVIAAIKRN